MADETPNTPPADEETPKRRRARRAPAAESAEPVEAAAAEETPKRRRVGRARAKVAEEVEAVAVEGESVAEEAPKPRRTRARKAEVAAEEPVAAEEAAAVEEPAVEEAPKPRRTRARAAAPAAAEETAAPEEEVAEPPAPRRPRVRAPLPSLRRGRDRNEPERQHVLVFASARYVRSSARKARLVCDHIRGKSVPEARAILAFAQRGVARDWAKLLESAVANAEHNFELVGDELRVKEAYADEGPTLKRFRPRAMGRATPIHKKTAHLSITLTPED